MNKFLKTIITLFVITYASFANAAITDGKFGIAQIFDVQYYWNGTTLNASNFIAPYDKDFQTVTATAGQYFEFFDSTVQPGTHGLRLMNSDGSLSRIVHDYGNITALGEGAIFYLGSGFFGNVITTAEGFAYGSSASFENMDTDVNSADLTNYTFASTEPLAAGQTAAPAAPTPVYLSSITQSQTTQKTSSYAVTTGNNIDLTIIGNNNDVDVEQVSDGNYLDLYINGSTNTADISQSGTNADRNFADIDVDGSTNTLTLVQDGASEKVLFLDIDGSFGTYAITQQGIGYHYLDLVSIGNDGTVSILQEGSGNHSATLALENAGGNWDFTLTQSGDTNQLYSLPHNLSDNTVVNGVCYSGTCTMVVNQQ